MCTLTRRLARAIHRVNAQISRASVSRFVRTLAFTLLFLPLFGGTVAVLHFFSDILMTKERGFFLIRNCLTRNTVFNKQSWSKQNKIQFFPSENKIFRLWKMVPFSLSLCVYIYYIYIYIESAKGAQSEARTSRVEQSCARCYYLIKMQTAFEVGRSQTVGNIAASL